MTQEIKNYKDTLNLPKTNFAMRGNLPNKEPKQVNAWLEQDLYKTIREEMAGRPQFIFHDGPPYANGNIHIGHALNKVLKDMIVKSKILSGFDAPFIPGWDCHGLPIELNVEKKKGKVGKKIGATQFREECRKYAQKQVENQMADFQRLGIIADWKNPYLTKDFQFEADEIRALAKIITKGHLMKGTKPVYWSVGGHSALAEAEVEYEDKKSHAIFVRFKVINEEQFFACFNKVDNKIANIGTGQLSAVIWTTTPWTLPANQAVALNAELNYVVVQVNNSTQTERFFIAEDLVTQTMQKWGFVDYKIIATAKGKAFDLIQLQHPFYKRTVPIILAEHVTTDTGTGVVHTAPAHGPDDFNVGLKYKLPLDCPVDGRGNFVEGVAIFKGENVLKVDTHIIEVLEEQGNLVNHTMITHSYPHCWRTKTPLIFRATPQWFISMTKANLRDKAIQAIKNVKWVPDWGQSRIEGMVNDRPDWCISRQRFWGVPITIFIHKVTGEMHPNTVNFMEDIAKLVETKSIDAWYDLDIDAFLGKDAKNYEQVTDILDVWFDSGVSHYTVLNKRENIKQADLYLEGSDQHRGWFQSSLLTSLAMNDTPPYKQVLTHGFAVDKDGKKMSKSKGNVVAPQDITNKYGADILRLWISAADYRYEMTISDEIISRTADSYRRIRNTSRFLLANLNGFDPATDLVSYQDMLPLDKWVVGEAFKIQQQIIKSYEEYNFHAIYQAITHFCSIELGAFYLDVIKDRQYTCKTNGLARHSAQSALYHIIQALTRWIAPILSFTAEEIWQQIPANNTSTIFTSQWYNQLNALDESKTMNSEFWQQIIAIRAEVTKQLEISRQQGIIKGSLTAEVVLYANEDLLNAMSHLKDELRFILITSTAKIQPLDNKPTTNKPTTAIASEIDGLYIAVNATNKAKCDRCWHHSDDVGKQQQDANLCQRCVTNVYGDGEVRSFA